MFDRPDTNRKKTPAARPIKAKPAPASDFALLQSECIEKKIEELDKMLSVQEAENRGYEGGGIDSSFHNRLLDNVCEAVVFVDADFNITCWNRSAEQTTGLAAPNMLGMEFTPGLIGLTKPDGAIVSDVQCPVAKAMESRKQTIQEYGLVGRSGREVSIALNVAPVVVEGRSCGAVVLLQDLSAKMDMKRQLTELYHASVLDPLTRVANRAEFERTLREYAKAHRATESKCSIIVCDIDFFKKVNDTYGHHIGDQALISFAQQLKKFVRARDIVARYGGEEFVILCANCDLKSAVERAEQIRMSLNRTPQQMLNGKTLSASFGVAELDREEEITEFFVRADKALFSAKKLGRNRVELAGEGDESPEEEQGTVDKSVASGISWRKIRSRVLFCEEFRSSTPKSLLTNKVRGFATEMNATIREWESDYYSMTVLAVDPSVQSRRTHFRVDIEVVEAPNEHEELPVNYIRISVFPPKARMFRRVHVELHTRLVVELRRYLMLSDETSCVKLNPAATTSGREEEEQDEQEHDG